MNTETLHTKTENQSVPQLRFAEFDVKWNEKSIGQFIELKSGHAFKGDEISEDDTGIPILRGINITEGYIRHNVDIDRYYLGKSDKLDDLFLKEGDLVLGMDGSKVGKNVAIITKDDEGALLIQRVARLRPKDNASIKFIYQHIHSFKFHRYVDIVNTSSGIPHISSKQITDFKIFFPTLPEQQKIAGFLTAVDTKIQQLTQKKELLEQYKKGVMQQLFSQQLRFKQPDGSDFADWEEKKLGEVCESIKSGKSRSSDKGEIPLYGSTGLIGKCDEYSHDGKYILIARVGANAGTINIVEDRFGVSDNTLVVICDDSTEIDFVFYYLNHYNLNRLIFGSGQPLITGGQLKKLKVNLPSKEEQQKIASYLSALDTKIESVAQQITQTQLFKKGLLQQMFV